MKNKNRLFFLLLFVALLLAEVLIALFVHDNFIRPYGGDILVVVVIYAFLRFIFPYKFKLLPLYVFIFAVFVEIMQYIDIVAVLGLQDNAFISTVIGRSFSFADILCYFAGSVINSVVEAVYRKKLKKQQ